MCDNKLWHVLVLGQMISLAASSFYHEPSYKLLRPSDATNQRTDFGFSMDYQNGPHPKLVVGSPHSDLVGRVYSCPMNSEIVTTCDNLYIDVKNIANDYDKNDTEQNFCLGATIAATPNYFMTCAPLWTTTVKKDAKSFTGSYGTCFVYNNNGSVHQFQGILEQYKQNIGDKYGAVYGGIGWSLLADPVNNKILLGKPFKDSDIQYVDSSNLGQDRERKSQSLFFSNRNSKMKEQNNFWKSTLVGNAMAAGKFFSKHAPYESTMYAFSAKDGKDIGNVYFLAFQEENPSIHMVGGSVLKLLSKAGNMYGACLWATDLDTDGLSDLLVGAPAQTYINRVEAGAVYIYTGRNMSDNIRDPIITVLGEKPQSRFGSAIVTTDLDGDAKPEVIVSAPYEDEGRGALYIISGNELYKHMLKSSAGRRQLPLSNLLLTQRIQKTEFKSFGFSLKIVSDINENGCNEIAVGTPQNASVVLLRCIPVINATVSVQREKKDVKIADTQYDVKVCVKISYPEKPKKISTVLQVVSKIRGPGATLVKDKFDVDLAERHKPEYCDKVTVSLTNEIGKYDFSSTLEYKDESVFTKPDFDPTWVQLSMFSKRSDFDSVTRVCPADMDCTPKLSLKILWDDSKPPKTFTVNKKTELNITIMILNNGYDAYDTCVRLDVIGVTERVPCRKDDDGRYLCSPYVKPLSKDKPYTLKFGVAVERARSLDDEVHIKADLYNSCSYPNFTHYEETIKLVYEIKDVYILESSHNVTITDTQIADTTLPMLIDTQKYEIVNNGSIFWENVKAIISVRKKDYIQNYIISEKRCNYKSYTPTHVKFHCSGLTLGGQKPTNRLPITVRLEVLHATIMQNLVDNKLVLESDIQLTMASVTGSLLTKEQTTTIFFEKTKSFANNLPAIIFIVIVVALIIIAGVVFILYKIGFFERKEKERLDTLKESVRRKSQSSGAIRPGASEQQAESGENSMEDDFDIEVIDDSAFEPAPSTTEDNAALIVEDQNNPSRKRTVSKDASQKLESSKL